MCQREQDKTNRTKAEGDMRHYATTTSTWKTRTSGCNACPRGETEFAELGEAGGGGQQTGGKLGGTVTR